MLLACVTLLVSFGCGANQSPKVTREIHYQIVNNRPVAPNEFLLRVGEGLRLVRDDQGSGQVLWEMYNATGALGDLKGRVDGPQWLGRQAGESRLSLWLYSVGESTRSEIRVVVRE